MPFCITTNLGRSEASRPCLTLSSVLVTLTGRISTYMLHTSVTETMGLGHLRTQKRGRICIAQSQGACLVGEATLSDCVCVGVLDRTTKRWHPADSSEFAQSNFIFHEENNHKHQLLHPGLHPMFETSYQLFAWVLTDVIAYKEPVAYHPKKGAVIFVDLAGRIPSNRHSASCPLLFEHILPVVFMCEGFYMFPPWLDMPFILPASGTDFNGHKCCNVLKIWWLATWIYIGSCAGLHVYTASASCGRSCGFSGRSA